MHHLKQMNMPSQLMVDGVIKRPNSVVLVFRTRTRLGVISGRRAVLSTLASLAHLALHRPRVLCFYKHSL